jgi:hypothetical protein
MGNGVMKLKLSLNLNMHGLLSVGLRLICAESKNFIIKCEYEYEYLWHVERIIITGRLLSFTFSVVTVNCDAGEIFYVIIRALGIVVVM